MPNQYYFWVKARNGDWGIDRGYDSSPEEARDNLTKQLQGTGCIVGAIEDDANAKSH